MHSTHYRDDIVIFSKTTKHQLNNTKLILYFFELLMRLKINFSKSYLVGMGLNQQEVLVTAAMLGCDTFDFPITYLEILFHKRSLPTSYWNFIVNKVERQLSSWKRNSYPLLEDLP